MSFKLWLLPFVCICMMLMSATTVSNEQQVAVSTQTTVPGKKITEGSVHQKLTFFERLLVKTFSKKIAKLKLTENADKQAQAALIYGIVAFGVLVLGLVVPFVGILTIPAGILAMVKGRNALDNGTTMVSKAKTGKALGLAALITLGVLLLAAVLIVAAFLSNW